MQAPAQAPHKTPDTAVPLFDAKQLNRCGSSRPQLCARTPVGQQRKERRHFLQLMSRAAHARGEAGAPMERVSADGPPEAPAAHGHETA